MEEDTIELIDYLRVIWKRKMLIIAGTLICTVAAAAISLRLPEVYRADALINIGKVVDSLSPSLSPSLIPFDTSRNLAKSIPAEYGLNSEEALKYPLKVKTYNKTSLIKIIVEGHDRRIVEERFKGVINKLIDDHLRKAERSIQPYRVFIGKLEIDIKTIQKDIVQFEARLEKMNIEKTDPVAVAMLQNTLWNRESNSRNLQQKLLLYRSVVDSLKEYKTELIGEVKSISIKPNKIRRIALAGAVGLMISIFLAFFIEYLGKVMEREKEVDSV